MKDEEAYAEHTTTSPEWFVVQDARHSCVSRMPRLRNYGIAAEYGVIEQALKVFLKEFFIGRKNKIYVNIF